LPDQVIDPCFTKISSDLAAFHRAGVEGKTYEWIEQRFGTSYAKLHLDSAEVIHDIFSGHLINGWRDCFVCQSCGRLHMEDPFDKMRSVSYLPETSPPRLDILAATTTPTTDL